MGTPFVGEIRMFGFGRTPNGWLSCDGSLQPISEYDVLYTLLGTIYGGDGQSTFAVPDLRGRLPVNQGQGPGLSPYTVGQLAGTESVTLTLAQMPAHPHTVIATQNVAASGGVANSVVPGTVSGETIYVSDTTGGAPFALNPAAITLTGGNQPHDNTMPTLTVQFCIAYAGVFPQQS